MEIERKWLAPVWKCLRRKEKIYQTKRSVAQSAWNSTPLLCLKSGYVDFAEDAGEFGCFERDIIDSKQISKKIKMEEYLCQTL